MDRFSIIVPKIGDDSQFEDTLASVLRTRPPNSQIIVAHLGQYDDPYDLKQEVDFVGVEPSGSPSKSPSGDSLAALLNAGIQHARGRFTTTLLPGVELLEAWDSPVEQAFHDHTVGSVCGPIVRTEKSKLMASLGVAEGFGYRRKLVGCNRKVSTRNARRTRAAGPSLAAGFYRTTMLQQLAPLDERLDSVYLDLDIALAAQTVGYQNVVIQEPVAKTEHAVDFKQQASQPHGKSAQRAAIRHHNRTGPGFWAETGFTMACELLSTPLSPSRFGHAMSRFAAVASLRNDRDFAARVGELTVAEPVTTAKPNPQPEFFRRAA